MPKFRHQAGEVLHARTAELAILAELLLRGPQTIGEIRGRASRMSPLESLEVAQNLVNALMARPEALVRELPPLPGSRAVRYTQLLCDELPVATAVQSTPPQDDSLAERVFKLESEVAQLREEIMELKKSV